MFLELRLIRTRKTKEEGQAEVQICYMETCVGKRTEPSAVIGRHVNMAQKESTIHRAEGEVAKNTQGFTS